MKGKVKMAQRSTLDTQPPLIAVHTTPPPPRTARLPVDLEGIAMIWLREMSRLWRQRTRLYGAIVRALVWLFALGFGLRRSFVPIAGLSYAQFVFPGVIAMTIIFSALQSAISIIWDREFGFLKEVLVAPTPRSTLVLGKCLGGATSSTAQAAIMLVFAPLAGVTLTPLHVLAALGAMFITALALSALGIVIALRMTDFENFGTIQNFITQPLYLFSGAIFPTRGVPGWLSALLFLNPLTYGVNAIRGALLGYNVSEVPRDIVALLGVTIVFLGIALMLARGEA
ncbi:MAG: Efflux ABC transporter, permease protein [Ktedonobacterales bacterium]|nr:MAG: Efflux ABC transporter, permease protein [Ktedonobacterales bacterium]